MSPVGRSATVGFSASTIGMAFAALSPAALQCPPTRIALQLASETNALRQPPSTFAGHISMNPKTIVATSTAAEHANVDPEFSPIPIASPVARGWTRDVDALCRALDAQQRAHFPSIDAEEK